MNFALLLASHLIGDYLLQNEWMQRKTASSFVCTVHVGFYCVPFVVLAVIGQIPWWAAGAIFIQHWLQDRFALHKLWMWMIGSSTPEKWPLGPFVHDQAWHVAFLAVLSCA
jgi:hypothetical protein